MQLTTYICSALPTFSYRGQIPLPTFRTNSLLLPQKPKCVPLQHSGFPRAARRSSSLSQTPDRPHPHHASTRNYHQYAARYRHRHLTNRSRNHLERRTKNRAYAAGVTNPTRRPRFSSRSSWSSSLSRLVSAYPSPSGPRGRSHAVGHPRPDRHLKGVHLSADQISEKKRKKKRRKERNRKRKDKKAGRGDSLRRRALGLTPVWSTANVLVSSVS